MRLAQLIFALLLTIPASAVNHFIRDGATGSSPCTGDWTSANACDNLPATLTRGDTYYIADGTYGAYAFDDAVSGATLITIKKAVSLDHGTETGWSAAFGDGQAHFTSTSANIWNFTTNYWVLDGNSIIGSYGFKVDGTLSGYPTDSSRMTIRMSFNLSNITLKSIEMDLNGESWVSAVYTNFGNNLTYSNMKVSNTARIPFYMWSVTDSLWEYLDINRRVFTGLGEHGDAIVMFGGKNNTTNTIRYNKFDWQGLQIQLHAVADISGTPQPIGQHNIYGNTFFGGDTSGVGILFDDGGYGGVMGPFNVYNNTFHDVDTPIYSWAGTSTATFRNNIFHAGNTFVWGSWPHDYNWYFDTPAQSETNIQNGAGNPFVNTAGEDFHLTAATNAGDTSIGATYNTDPNGTLRGADGVWDRGAFEFTTGGGGGSGDLILNGVFTGYTAGRANSWLDTNGGATYVLSEDVSGHTGSAQKIAISAAGGWGMFFYQEPAMVLGTTYTWTFWYKTSGTNSMSASVTDGPFNNVVFNEDLPGTSGTWTEVERTFVYDNSAATMVRVYSAAVGDFWIDDMTLVVGGTSPSITTTSCPGGTANVVYAGCQLANIGGLAPFSWDLSLGTLPAGLSIGSGTGLISGTPTTPGTSNFTARVTDAVPVTDTQALTIIISSITITIISELTYNGLNSSFYVTMAAEGGTPPYTWSLLSGALPTGLTLSSAGILSGITMAVSDYTFTIRATDSAMATGDRAYLFQVSRDTNSNRTKCCSTFP